MTDAVLVVLLVVLIWAVILYAPAADARATRHAEFMGSLRGEGDDGGTPRRRSQPLSPRARRRYVLGGLLVALAATFLLGLLPTFRLLLAAHLLLLDSFLAYVGALVFVRDREARLRLAAPEQQQPLPRDYVAVHAERFDVDDAVAAEPSGPRDLAAAWPAGAAAASPAAAGAVPANTVPPRGVPAGTVAETAVPASGSTASSVPASSLRAGSVPASTGTAGSVTAGSVTPGSLTAGGVTVAAPRAAVADLANSA